MGLRMSAEGIGAIIFVVLFSVGAGSYYEIRHEHRFPWITVKSLVLIAAISFFVSLFV